MFVCKIELHDSEEKNIRQLNKIICNLWFTHSRSTCFITGWISILERISCMIQRQIHFNRPFEVSNYFQKEIYSILIATVHIRIDIWSINFYQCFCNLNVCNRNNDTVWLKRLKRFHSYTWQLLSLGQQQHECMFKCLNHTDLCDRSLHGWTKWSQHCDRTPQSWGMKQTITLVFESCSWSLTIYSINVMLVVTPLLQHV